MNSLAAEPDVGAGRIVLHGDSGQQVCLTFDPKRHIFYSQGDIIRFWAGGSRAPSLAVKSDAEAKMPDGNGWYNQWVMEAAVISVALSAPGQQPETSWLPSYTLQCDSAHTRAVKNIPYLHWKQISVIHVHTGEELKTQSDITTTSCFFWLPWRLGFEYFRRLVDDESVELGGSHFALLPQQNQIPLLTGKPDQTWQRYYSTD